MPHTAVISKAHKQEQIQEHFDDCEQITMLCASIEVWLDLWHS